MQYANTSSKWRAACGRHNLNQITGRDVPAYLNVIGAATATATNVNVNNTLAYRKGEYYRVELNPNNASAAVWQSVTNRAVQSGTTNSTTGNLFLPKTAEVFAYDADGNLTNDGRWAYVWDGENRLVRQFAPTTAPSGSVVALVFGYDWQGRRISKTVSNWTGSAWSKILDEKFLYDGWNQLTSLNASNTTVVRAFFWGSDLSGSMQGAGGVGGLLAVNAKGVGVGFTAFDGNGNVMALVNAAGGDALAKYEYGPFSELLRASGTLAKLNPFRFSTKFQDDETDQLYYGYRYLNPSSGRWLSRDPIEEGGGVNAYGFVANTPMNAIDVLGLEKRTVRYVGKSFINGIGPLGSLGNRAGLPVPPSILSINGVDLNAISGDGQYADQRMAIFASVIPTLARAAFTAIGENYDPFNQNPDSDAKDGEYRLYGKVEITARCCGSILTSYSYKTDKEGGRELPGVRGTINMDVDDGRGAWGFSLKSATVTWKTWGRPNLLAEPGMQWIAFRTSVNIWHEGKVKITCNGGKPIFTVLGFRGSRYPSRRLWEDGTLIRDVAQGSFSDLWNAQSWWEPTMVAE